MKAKIEEIWKDVPDYEGRYQASNLGRIRSLDRRVNSKHEAGRLHKGRILNLSPISGGYLNAALGRKNNLLIHRVIAITFIPNPENKRCVNHKDGDKTNNEVSNLEWVTYSENEKHSYRVLGKKPNPNGTGKIPGNAKKVKQFLNGKLIATHKTATHAAKKIGTSQGRVSCCARGETKSCYGFQFKYV